MKFVRWPWKAWMLPSYLPFTALTLGFLWLRLTQIALWLRETAEVIAQECCTFRWISDVRRDFSAEQVCSFIHDVVSLREIINYSLIAFIKCHPRPEATWFKFNVWYTEVHSDETYLFRGDMKTHSTGREAKREGRCSSREFWVLRLQRVDFANLRMRQDVMNLHSLVCFTHALYACISDPHSHQSPEEVVALNAAAIIANIKLQSQLSKNKSPNGKSERDPTASPQGNTGIITSLFPWYVIITSHPTKHWSLLQLTENAASSTLSFRGYVFDRINTDTGRGSVAGPRGYWATVHRAQACEAQPGVNEMQALWFSLPWWWQMRGNVWIHIQVRARSSGAPRLLLHSSRWVLILRGHLKLSLSRWVQRVFS